MQTQRKADHLPPGGQSRPGLRQVRAICALALLALLSSARAAQPATASPEPTHKLAEIQFVKSVFVNSPGVGTDPFFPKSTRRGAPVGTNPGIEVAPSFGFLSLKGISGSKVHRLAIINNKTFEAGEEGDLKTGSQTVRVKCVEIRDDCVVV